MAGILRVVDGKFGCRQIGRMRQLPERGMAERIK